MSRNVLILDGHPDPADDRLIHALSAAYREGAQASSHTVQMIRLADLTFPVLRSQADYDKSKAGWLCHRSQYTPEQVEQLYQSLAAAQAGIAHFQPQIVGRGRKDSLL